MGLALTPGFQGHRKVNVRTHFPCATDHSQQLKARASVLTNLPGPPPQASALGAKDAQSKVGKEARASLRAALSGRFLTIDHHDQVIRPDDVVRERGSCIMKIHWKAAALHAQHPNLQARQL